MLLSVGCRASENAVVSDQILAAPRNLPPVRNDYDYRLVEIDGRPVEREQVPSWKDMMPGALIAPGIHVFKVAVTPALHHPGEIPTEITFTAVVEARKRYLIGSKAGLPILVEERQGPTAQSE
jgi:hypothetical protein